MFYFFPIQTWKFMFLGIYSFLVSCPLYHYTTVHSDRLWSFVFLWYHLLYLLFNSWLHLFEFLFFLVSLAKSFSTLCIFLKNHLLLSLVFSIVFLVFILFISPLMLGCVYSSFSCFWRLFETFLISQGRHLSLWIFLLELLLPQAINLGVFPFSLVS